MERRELLALFGRAAGAGLLASSLPPLRAMASARPVGTETVEAATAIARSYRRLWPTTPAEDLRELVLGHLRFVSRLLPSTTSEKDRAALAAAGSETALLAAWLAEDLWDLGTVSHHYQTARSYAERSGNNLLRAYVEGCASYWAARAGNGREAVAAIQQAKQLLPANAPDTAHVFMAAREATSHAAAHDQPAMSSAMARAERALDRTSGSGETTWPWMFPVDARELSRYRGFAAVSLGLPKTALPALREGLASLGTAPSKRRSYTLGKLAEAHAQAGEVEQACDLGADAFTMAAGLGDIEGLMMVRSVRVRLVPVETARAVRAFDDRVLSTLLTLPR